MFWPGAAVSIGKPGYAANAVPATVRFCKEANHVQQKSLGELIKAPAIATGAGKKMASRKFNLKQMANADAAPSTHLSRCAQLQALVKVDGTAKHLKARMQC